jgi:hypothetical protein
VAFGERVVVRGVRPVVRAGDPEIGEQEGGGLGFHRPAPIGMQGQLAGCHLVLGDGVLQQRLEEGGTFAIGDAPADHAAAEDVEDDVEVEVAPLGWPHQLGDVPGPDLIGAFSQQFGLLVGGMPELGAALADFAVLGEDAVHGADRAVVDALVEQAGVDLGRRLVGEARRVQQVEDGLLLRCAEGPGGFGSWAGDGRWRGSLGAVSLQAGAREARCAADRRHHAASRQASSHRCGQGTSSLGANGTPSSSATFFWTSMMASARASRRVRRAWSRCNAAISAASGLGAVVLRPRLAGVSASKTPAVRCRRQSVSAEE